MKKIVVLFFLCFVLLGTHAQAQVSPAGILMETRLTIWNYDEETGYIPFIEMQAVLHPLDTVYYSIDLVNWTRVYNNDSMFVIRIGPNWFRFIFQEMNEDRGFFRILPFLSKPLVLNRNLTLNMSGEDVADLQGWLLKKQFLKKSNGQAADISNITPLFDNNVKLAVRALQTSATLPITDICDEATRAYIHANP